MNLILLAVPFFFLLIALELDEVLNVADTVAVIYDGAIQGTFPQSEADERTIGLMMAGGGTDAAE